MKKLVIVINGIGGSGKDTLIHLVANHHKTMNVSSIDPIKDAAKICGVEPQEFKLRRGRKLLSDLKMLFTEYNDYPTQYLLNKFIQFQQGNNEIMFVQIREPDEIAKFKKKVERLTRESSAFWQEPPETKICTLLIRGFDDLIWGNEADDIVEDYPYDYAYGNIGRLENLESDFMPFFERIMREQHGL